MLIAYRGKLTQSGINVMTCLTPWDVSGTVYLLLYNFTRSSVPGDPAVPSQTHIYINAHRSFLQIRELKLPTQISWIATILKMVKNTKGMVNPKMKMYSPSGQPRCRWVGFFIRFGEIQHSITCSLMDPLQWMGAVRMRVQTADKNITIIHK